MVISKVSLVVIVMSLCFGVSGVAYGSEKNLPAVDLHVYEFADITQVGEIVSEVCRDNPAIQQAADSLGVREIADKVRSVYWKGHQKLLLSVCPRLWLCRS